MRVAVILEEGARALPLPGLASAQIERIGPAQATLGACDAVLVGTALDPRRPLAEALRAHAKAGLPLLGLGIGFGSLCALGLLPGELRRTADEAAFAPVASCVRVEGLPTPFTAGIPAGRVVHLACVAPLAYHAADRLSLEQAGQVVFRHCDEWAGLSDAHNPCQAPAAIAGVCNDAGNVVGLQAWPMQWQPADAAPRPGAFGAEQIFASMALWVANRNASAGKTRRRST